MKKTAKLFIMLSFLCVMAISMPFNAQAEEKVYDLELSEVVLYLPSQSDLVVKNLVNDKINIAFDVTNNGTERYGYIMCAYYSPDGQFLGQECKTNQADPNITKTFRHDFLIDNSEGEVGSVKIFAFDSFENMKPIAEPVELHTATGEHPVLWMGKQETVNGYTRVYVMGDEYYGWYILDEGIDPDLLNEYGIKNVTVENGRITSITQEAVIGDVVQVSDGDVSGFTDNEGISYSFDPEGYSFFIVENDMLTEGDSAYPGEEYLRYGDRVIMAQEDGYVTDVYVVETIISSFGGYVEVLSSEAVVNETTQSAQVTVRHLDTNEIRTYELAAKPDPKNNGAYSRITFIDEEKALVELTSGEIFSEGTFMSYYMDHGKIVLAPPGEVDFGEGDAFDKNRVVVFTEDYEWACGDVLYGDLNKETKIYLIRENGEVDVYTGCDDICNIEIEAERVYAVHQQGGFHHIYIFCGEVIHDPVVLYYTGVSNNTTLGTMITYYLNGEEKQSLVADGLELPEAGAYTFTIEGDEITSMTGIGIRGDLEAKLLNRYIKVNGKKYNFGDKYVIYDVSNGISEAEEIPFERELIVITGFEERVCEIFIVGKAETVVPSPEPKPEPEPEPVVNTSLVAYYYDWGMDKNGFTIQVAVDGESKTYEYVGETDIGLFEVGMYVLEIDSDDKVVALTSADGHIIEGKVAEVTDSYVTIGEQKVYFADKYVAAELDGLRAVEITEEDEVIAVLNEDGCITVVYVK